MSKLSWPNRKFMRLAGALLAAVLFVATSPSPPAAAQETTIFAAASLKNALDEIAEAWGEETGKGVAISYAGSSALARQIEQGAPADIFISANAEWMDTLAEGDLIKPETRRDLLSNRIVLIASGKDADDVDIEPGFDLVGLLDGGRLAMAMVDSVPGGIYGKAALTSLEIWDDVEQQVAQTDNVRAALALVARGEAPYGIVYQTDAVAEDNVSVVGSFPEETHPPIVYPVAVMKSSDNPDAEAFVEFLGSQEAAALFEEQGFTVIGE